MVHRFHYPFLFLKLGKDTKKKIGQLSTTLWTCYVRNHHFVAFVYDICSVRPFCKSVKPIHAYQTYGNFSKLLEDGKVPINFESYANMLTF